MDRDLKAHGFVAGKIHDGELVGKYEKRNVFIEDSRNVYRKHKDFEIIHTFLETLYISNRLHLPLKGILLIGY